MLAEGADEADDGAGEEGALVGEEGRYGVDIMDGRGYLQFRSTIDRHARDWVEAADR